jgi:hypothetical protein
MDEAFQDMLDKGLASVEKPIDLSKLTLYQATCCHFLSQPTVDCLSGEFRDSWQNYIKDKRN